MEQAGGNILDASCSFMSLDSIETQTYLHDWTKAEFQQQELDQKPTYEYFENDQITGTKGSDD